MKTTRNSLTQNSILVPSSQPTTPLLRNIPREPKVSDGHVVRLPQKPSICITGNAKSYFGLRLTCSTGRAGGGNHWGNLSKTDGSGPEGILALKHPAIATITVRGGNFRTLTGAVAGKSWTNGGADYVCHVPLNSVPAAISYLRSHFEICACHDAMASLQQHGVDVRNIPTCEPNMSKTTPSTNRDR